LKREPPRGLLGGGPFNEKHPTLKRKEKGEHFQQKTTNSKAKGKSENPRSGIQVCISIQDGIQSNSANSLRPIAKMDTPPVQNLPQWAIDACKKDNRKRPWKEQVTITPEDQKTFGEGEDKVAIYDKEMSSVEGAGAGTLAA